MGVMTCNKRGCDNILCDTYVQSVGYVCSECKEQFKRWLQGQTPLYLDSNSFILYKFDEFMQTEKGNTQILSDVSDVVDDFFNSYGTY